MPKPGIVEHLRLHCTCLVVPLGFRPGSRPLANAALLLRERTLLGAEEAILETFFGPLLVIDQSPLEKLSTLGLRGEGKVCTRNPCSEHKSW